MRVAEDQASLGHRSDLRNGGSSMAAPGVAAMTTPRAPGRATPPVRRDPARSDGVGSRYGAWPTMDGPVHVEIKPLRTASKIAGQAVTAAARALWPLVRAYEARSP